MKKKLIVSIIAASLAISWVACSSNNSGSNLSNNTNTIEGASELSQEITGTIKLNKSEITVDGNGVKSAGSIVTITSAGTYEVTGSIDDGQIIVDSADEENVYLILNNVDIKCQSSAPIYVKNAKNTIITLADNTENTLEDGSEYTYTEKSEDVTLTDEPSACIYSKDDLTINGDGALNVTANYNNGIVSKDDLKITKGNINVTAVHDGLRGKDSVTIKNGVITVNAGGDGIKANNTDTTKGTISIEGGTLNITSAEDAIQAETIFTMTDGKITILSGGGNENAKAHVETMMGRPGMQNTTIDTSTTEESISAKGIKAGVSATIDGGTINIDSADDSIHTNDSVTINGGTFTISAGDDGIHADNTLEINGGDISINKSYEGLEATDIIVNEGNVNLAATDDGVNAAGGNDSGNGGMFGADSFGGASGTLTINGGMLIVDAAGDGLDANGSITMTGGTAIVNGPENNGNGALDYDGTFDMQGGTLIAAGSTGMAQSTSTSSNQPSINVILSSLTDNTLVTLKDSSGEDILSFMPSKSYQSIVISSADLKIGESYSVYYGGTVAGTDTAGLYNKSSANGGTLLTEFILASSVMTISNTGATEGNPAGMGGGMHGGGGGRGQEMNMSDKAMH